jgi:hypothetical protein
VSSSTEAAADTDFFANRRFHVDIDPGALRQALAAEVKDALSRLPETTGPYAEDTKGVLDYLSRDKQHDSEGRNLSFAKQSFSTTELLVAAGLPAGRVLSYLVYRYRFNHYPRNKLLGEFPLLLAIEPTSICNIRCTMCFQMDDELGKNKSNLGYMSFDLFRRIIDEGARHDLNAVVLASRGEPTLNKQIGEMISYAKDAGVLDVKMNTNVTRLTADMSRKILASGLDTLVFSVDAAVKEEFERIRVGAKFDRIVANIDLFNEIRRKEFPNSKTRTRISMVLVDDSQDTIQAAKFWDGMVDEFAWRWAIPRLNIYSQPSRTENRPCSLLWERLYVWFDGTVNPCDEDYLSHLSVGRLTEGVTIRNLWLGEKMRAYRNHHLSATKNQLDPCARCPGF